MMSEIVIALLMSVVGINIVILLMLFIKNILENILSKCQLGKILKGFVLYLVISLPAVIAYIYYHFLYIEKIKITGEDVHELFLVRGMMPDELSDLDKSIILILFFVVWITGIIIFGILRLFNEYIFLSKLEKVSKDITDAKIIAVKNKLQNEMGIKKDIRLFTNPVIPSPFIIGFVRPKIYIPEVNFSEVEIEFILKHELTHLVSQDYLYRKLIFFICLIYWFNPVTYILSDRFIEINEMSCDEKVLDGYKKQEKVAYMRLLCSLASEKYEYNSILYFKGKTCKSLERRIKSMIKNNSGIRALPYVLISTFIIAAFPVVSYAATDIAVKLPRNISDRMSTGIDIKDGYKPIFNEEQHTKPEKPKKNTLLNKLVILGVNYIDVNIGKGNKATTSTVSLQQGGKIEFSFESDNTSDKFIVGLLNDKGDKIASISSQNGELLYKYKVDKPGRYKVYISNNTNKSIHVKGRFYIDN